MDAATADMGNLHEGSREHSGGKHTSHIEEWFTMTNLPCTNWEEHNTEKTDPSKNSTSTTRKGLDS